VTPKILLLDIETAPSLGWVWQKWQTDVVDFKQTCYILSYSAKWLGGRHVTKGLIDYPGYEKDRENDKALVGDLWELFNEADVIVAHNGDEFDVKKCNMRFSVHGLNPPSPYKTVDTKKLAKKHFAFESNSLNDLGKVLGLGKKVSTGGFGLWLKVMEGDEKAWKRMKGYNRGDVTLLEKVYLHFRPWSPGHPVWSGESCPKCGVGKLHRRGEAVAKTVTYQRYQCQGCGGWSRSRKSIKSQVAEVVGL
jgi:RNase H-like protein